MTECTADDRLSRALRALGLLVILGFASVFTPLINHVAAALQPDGKLARADAIVVLAAGVQADQSLNARSLVRFVRGTVLVRDGLAPIIVYSGTPVEAAVRRRLAQQLGVRGDAILTEDRAHTTQDEATLIAERLRGDSIRRIVLVTSSIHMGRAARVFEKAGFEVIPAPADVDSVASARPESRFELSRGVAQEVAARLYYRMSGRF